jgi:hyperosmotically inducible periplasmic protein
MKRIIFGTIPALGLAALLAGCNDQQGSSGSGTDQSSGSTPASSQSAKPDQSAKDADNTALNKRDRPGDTLTSGDQGNSESDRELARKIRREIVKNDQLSTTAKNIKIIVAEGKITLRGPVKSEEEKNQIASIAQGAGAGSVENQLEVKQATEPKGE